MSSSVDKLLNPSELSRSNSPALGVNTSRRPSLSRQTNVTPWMHAPPPSVEVSLYSSDSESNREEPTGHKKASSSDCQDPTSGPLKNGGSLPEKEAVTDDDTLNAKLGNSNRVKQERSVSIESESPKYYSCCLMCSELKEAFDVLDEDKDGLLSVDDLAKFMRLIGMTASNAEMSELILEFDSDGDGYLSYQDFTKVLNQDIFEGDPNGDIIREAFRQFDQDGTGYVTQADLCTIFQQLGEERLVTDELSEILREYNVCNEGAINYENMIEGIQDAYKKQNKVSHDQH